MVKDIQAFAREHSRSLGKNVLTLIEGILAKHDAAIIEYCCEQQQQIEALEEEVARYKKLYHAACEGRRHFRQALREERAAMLAASREAQG